MKVRYTPRALADLREIHSYIADNNARAAQRVVEAIAKSAELIGKDPGRGHKTDEEGVRRIPVVRYRYAIDFRVVADAVDILHVRHSSRLSPPTGEL